METSPVFLYIAMEKECQLMGYNSAIRDVPLTPYFHLTDGNLTKDTCNVLWRL